MNNILEVRNLQYKDILKDVTFSLKENTFNILIGAGGSGKTTLAKCVLGLINYEGEIFFANNILSKNNIEELRKNIGFVTDSNNLIEGNCMYNIIFPLINLNYDVEKAKKKVYSLTKKLDIDDVLSKNINKISQMERKLVCIASALIHSPKLIIIDDCLDDLDNYYRNKIIKYLKEKTNITVLFITNRSKDFLLADNLIFIKDGKIISQCETKEILKDEKIFIRNNVKLPFMVDLSNKLMSYELLDKVILDVDEMVDEIWNKN